MLIACRQAIRCSGPLSMVSKGVGDSLDQCTSRMVGPFHSSPRSRSDLYEYRTRLAAEADVLSLL